MLAPLVMAISAPTATAPDERATKLLAKAIRILCATDRDRVSTAPALIDASWTMTENETRKDVVRGIDSPVRRHDESIRSWVKTYPHWNAGLYASNWNDFDPKFRDRSWGRLTIWPDEYVDLRRALKLSGLTLSPVKPRSYSNGGTVISINGERKFYPSGWKAYQKYRGTLPGKNPNVEIILEHYTGTAEDDERRYHLSCATAKR